MCMYVYIYIHIHHYDSDFSIGRVIALAVVNHPEEKVVVPSERPLLHHTPTTFSSGWWLEENCVSATSALPIKKFE